MKQKYPDHSWVKNNPWKALQSAGRNSPNKREGEGWVWRCVRCGMQVLKVGQESPHLQYLLNVGKTINCDLSLVSQIMES